MATKKGKKATKGRKKTDQPDLARDLDDFAAAQPGGWSHEDWMNFLEYLAQRGHDTSNPDAIGIDLERKRLALILGEVPGMGPKRVQNLVERYDTLWNLRQATVDELAEHKSLTRALAERVYEAVH